MPDFGFIWIGVTLQEGNQGHQKSGCAKTALYCTVRDQFLLKQVEAFSGLDTLDGGDVAPMANGYDIMLDTQGYVSEASGENIFVVRDGVIYTPTTHSVLNGITRATMIELARERGVSLPAADAELCMLAADSLEKLARVREELEDLAAVVVMTPEAEAAVESAQSKLAAADGEGHILEHLVVTKGLGYAFEGEHLFAAGASLLQAKGGIAPRRHRYGGDPLGLLLDHPHLALRLARLRRLGAETLDELLVVGDLLLAALDLLLAPLSLEGSGTRPANAFSSRSVTPSSWRRAMMPSMTISGTPPLA